MFGSTGMNMELPSVIMSGTEAMDSRSLVLEEADSLAFMPTNLALVEKKMAGIGHPVSTVSGGPVNIS
ncbi:hypothetical protein GCM10020370_50480 [Paenibacillus hodogayensis]